jgi:predicted aspartyl protease
LGLELLGEKESLSIPFEYKHNFLVLKIKMANIPLNFLFDTGAEHIILFKKEIADILGFKYEKSINIAGADLQQTINAFITRGISLQLKETIKVQRDLIVLEEDLLHLEELTGEPIDGILGARFFRGLTVEIDYKKRKLTIHKSHMSAIDDNYEKLQTTFINHKPYMNCSIEDNKGDTLSMDILLDTGAGVPFLLFLNEESKINLPEKFLVGNLGKGLGGDLKGYMGKTSKLILNKSFSYDDLITRYQHYERDSLADVIVSRDGLLGNPILERFKVVIDYVNERVYLKASKKYNKPIDYDISGLILYAFGQELSNYFVKEVLPGSPAEHAGIRKGDIIRRIGFFNANFYTLEQVYSKFIRKRGKKINLVLERNGIKIKKTLHLMDKLQ